MIVYELINNNQGGKPMATFWWDGKKIASDNQLALQRLRRITVHGTSFGDGKEFLENLKYHYKNGYLMIRRKEK